MTTNQVFAKYTELYDISTDIGKNIHYKIHTPTGTSHMRKLGGFYKQFKEYKYLGASIAWVPITTLPVDLMNVTYEGGEGTVDPRDLINPILHKGYKGESLVTDFFSERALWSENADGGDSTLQGYGETANGHPRMTESGGISRVGIEAGAGNETTRDWFRSLYYTSLTNSEWSKAHPREGFYKELFPLVRTLASNQQINPVGYPQKATSTQTQSKYKLTDTNIENINASEQSLNTNVLTGKDDIINRETVKPETNGNWMTYNWEAVNQGDIFTHEFERLGWMETSGKGYKLGTAKETLREDILNNFNQKELMSDLDLNRMPKVYMYLVQTPPAYKTKQYYRMSVTHQFTFRKFRQVHGLDMANMWQDYKDPGYYAALMGRGQPLTSEMSQKIIAGMKMYDEDGTLHDDDFMIPEYEPALENSIEADGEGVNIEKISDGVF